jgi:hypothetical protein
VRSCAGSLIPALGGKDGVGSQDEKATVGKQGSKQTNDYYCVNKQTNILDLCCFVFYFRLAHVLEPGCARKGGDRYRWPLGLVGNGSACDTAADRKFTGAGPRILTGAWPGDISSNKSTKLAREIQWAFISSQ